jgi:hypothetical protein
MFNKGCKITGKFWKQLTFISKKAGARFSASGGPGAGFQVPGAVFQVPSAWLSMPK